MRSNNMQNSKNFIRYLVRFEINAFYLSLQSKQCFDQRLDFLILQYNALQHYARNGTI